MGVNSHIIDFTQLYKFDLDLVGKKAYQLSELKQLGIPIPDGFVIIPFLHFSENLIREIRNAYKKLSSVFKETSLNIFSSSLNNKSTQILDIKGDANLILTIKTIWASHINNPVAIVVQKNIKSKIKGKIFTNDPLINDENLIKLAKKIQTLFYFPQEIEYVIKKGKIFVTQVKPFTDIIKELQKKEKEIINLRKAIIKGIPINPGIVTGVVKLINNQNFDIAKNSEIVVTKNLNKSLYNKIKKAKAVVTDTVLKTPIDKFHYRKIIKVPTITGTENATKILQNGNIVTVNGMSGEIYSGGFI